MKLPDNKFFNYIKTRGIGYFMLLPAAILAIIVAFVYMGEFVGGEDKYWSAIAFLLPLFAAFAYGLCYYKHTARYAGLVMFILLLIGLAVTVNTIYYHIVDVVFKATQGAAEGETVNPISAVSGGIVFMFVAYILDIILCAVASFFGQYAKAKNTDGAENADNAEESAPAEEVTL